MQELMSYNRNIDNLHTHELGKKYIYFDEIDSTQKEIWRRIEQNNIYNGTLIRAEKQTAGIGTHGRRWITEEKNIAFSFYLELNCNIAKIDGLTTQIAQIIIDLLKEMYNLDLKIKLPNDIYFNGKKIGGILTETKVKGSLVKFIVVGIGINNEQTIFENELENIATSIKKEFGIVINVESFLANFCNRFEKIIFERIEDNKL